MSAPAKPSKMKISLFCKYAAILPLIALNFSLLIGRFTLPHAISLWIDSVSTINLSLGERPVYLPVVTTKAPVLLKEPSPKRNAASVN